jgi:hypothetical protein
VDWKSISKLSTYPLPPSHGIIAPLPKEGGNTPDKILWSRKDKDGKLHSQPTAIAPTQHIPRMSFTKRKCAQKARQLRDKNKDKEKTSQDKAR